MKRIVGSWSLVVAACTLLMAATPAQAQRQWIEGGPNPTRYEIDITPNAEAGTFAGETRIQIEASEAAASVTLNALNLDIRSATIDGAAARVTTDETAQTITLTPRGALSAGQHTIRIVYTGRIIEEAYGLFRVTYEANGVTKRALATQFEPGDARRLAPMWDQPNRRAVFALTVTAPSDQMVVSNMPAIDSAPAGRGLTRVRFADTPSMSSYLLFMAVGDFERVTADADGVEVGVVVRRGETARAQEALRAGVESVRYFTEYFGIPYPLPKLDMVAVPGAGGFAAMENWGAILYFDQYLLLDDQLSSEADRQNVFSTVAHEIAHQWFGNLVTMNWWNDLWLNEGFASWMAAKAIEELHPDWNPWLAQLTTGTATATALDARDGTHPVVQEVNTIDDANLAFDTITYEKGLAVIRMIEAYVGEDDFRQGVRDYLNAHLYGNTETDDLWRAIQAASGQPVLAIAQSFTTQPGFPVLEATDTGRCNARGASTAIRVHQRRFAMDDVSRTAELWSVPVVARRLNGEATRMVLAPQAETTINLSPRCGPYLLNAGQSGLFRVLYNSEDFEELSEQFTNLDDADQLGLLLDYWAFGRSGDAPFTNYLDLVDRVPADANALIISDTAASMLSFAQYANGRPSQPGVAAYGRAKLQPFLARLGWDARANEGSNDGIARATLIGALGSLGDEAVAAEARRRVASGALAPGIRDAVMDVYASNATPAEYDAMVAQARAETDFVEQRRLWLRIAGARDDALAQRTLTLVEGETIPRLLRPGVVQELANSHPRMAWDFIVSHRALMESLLDPLTRLQFPTEVASASSDPAIADELGVYARDFPEGARATVAAAQSTIRLRAETVRERMPAVEAWIARQEGGARAGSSHR